jgi:hypothetical protein
MTTLAPVTAAGCGTSGDFALVVVSEPEPDDESSAAL